MDSTAQRFIVDQKVKKHLDSYSSTSVGSDTNEEILSSELDLLNPRLSPRRSRQLKKRSAGNTRSSEAINLGVDSFPDAGKVCDTRKSTSSLDLLQGRKDLQRRRSKRARRPVTSRSSLTRKPSQKQVTLEETELSCGDVVLIRRKAQYFDDSEQASSSVFTEEEYKHITAGSDRSSVIVAHSDNFSENKEILEKTSWSNGRDIGCGEGSLILVSGKPVQPTINQYISNSLVKSDSSDLDSSIENYSASNNKGKATKLATNFSKQSDSAHGCENFFHGMQAPPTHLAARRPSHIHHAAEEWYASTVNGECHLREKSPKVQRHDQCSIQNEQFYQSQRHTMNQVAGDASAFPLSSEHDHQKVQATLQNDGEEFINVHNLSTQADSKTCSSKDNFIGKEATAMGSVGVLPGTFPFQYTPSGNLKIVPNQVVYETQKMSVLVDNPKNAKVNVTKENGLKTNATLEMKKLMKRGPKKEVNHSGKVEPPSMAQKDSSHHLKLNPTTKRGDTGDGSGGDCLRITESDCMTKTSDEGNEPELSRFIYFGDNDIDWSRVTSLPAKTYMLKLLEDRVKNFVNPDMIVCVENNQFSCHHLVLQCYSTFFDRECEKIVELPSNKVTARAFSLIYDWMLYSGQDSFRLLRRDNILEIFMAAQYLGMKELEEQCWAFIDSSIIFSEATAFMLYLDARRKNNMEVAQLMIPRITTFFLSLVASHDFLLLSLEDVCTLLSSNYIQIHCEMQVFMSAVRWLMHDWSARAHYVVEVMSCVRFGWILPWQLVDIRRNPANPEFLQVSSHPEVMQMVEDGVAFAIVWFWYGKSNEQECVSWVKALDLKVPQQRNWDSKKQEYSSYQEFIDELDVIHKEMEKKRRQSKRMHRVNSVGQTAGQNSTSANTCTTVSNAVSSGSSKNVSNGDIHKPWVGDSGLQMVGEAHMHGTSDLNNQNVKGYSSLLPTNEVKSGYSKCNNGCEEDNAHRLLSSNIHDFPSHLVPPPEWLKASENMVKNSGSISRK